MFVLMFVAADIDVDMAPLCNEIQKEANRLS